MAEALGRVRSCSECRIHKLKCDAREDYSRPCTRCRKMGLACELSHSMKKSQRKTKTELARENAKLQEQLRNKQGIPEKAAIQRAMPSSQTAQDAPPRSWSNSLSHGNQDRRMSEISSHGDPDAAKSINSQGVPTGTNGFQIAAPTLTIDQVGRRKVNDCFALFFTHYEPSIPGLFDPDIPSEQYYERSPFLFWSIVATGARRYSEDPTLFERVVRQILQIALGSLFSHSSPIPTIEAVLVLCLWPIPTNTMFKDSSHALCGVAMQLAVQNGLHVLGREQDYSRQNIDAANSEVALRFRLWIHCVVIFQSTNLCSGFPHWTIPGTSSFESNVILERTLSPSLLYRFRLHKVQTDAIQAISQSTQLLEPDCGPPLNSLINIFDAQTRALVPNTNLTSDLLFQECTRLAIKAFHFFAAPDSVRTTGLVQLYALCCSVLNTAHELDVAENFAWYSTQWLTRMVLLGAFSILKITRSELRAHVDVQRGETSYFNAIKFMKKRSTENNDLDARNGIILTQLWASNSIYRMRDGTLMGDRLRLRSRLFTSVIFDTFWHWRATFGDWKTNPYAVDEDGTEPQAQNEEQAPVQWTSPSLWVPPPPLPPDDLAEPSTQNFLAFQTPALDFNAFSTFPDWDWAAQVLSSDDPNMLAVAHIE